MSCQLFAVGRGRGARTSTAASDQAVLAAAAHLTGRDRRLARAVGEHRVLTTGQLAALGFASVITARHRLAVLTGLGVLRRFRPHREAGSAPWHYLLGPVGAALLGAEDRDDKKWLSAVRADRCYRHRYLTIFRQRSMSTDRQRSVIIAVTRTNPGQYLVCGVSTISAVAPITLRN
jgi:Replication-relaxation